MKGTFECNDILYDADKSSYIEHFLWTANEDPKFVFGTLMQLWDFVQKSIKGETWDDLTKEVGLTSDEFNFLKSIEFGEYELRDGRDNK